MELVDEVHQIVGDAEAAGGGKVAGALVAPGGVQRVLGDGHHLHVGEAHLFHIGHQPARDVPVAEELALAGAAPGAQVHLVDIQRTVVDRMALPVLQPLLVAPLIAGQVVELGGVAGTGLGVEGVGVGLGQHPAVPGVDRVLICIVLLHARDKQLPHAAVQAVHGVGLLTPAVEVAHHGHAPGVGRPHAEDIAVLPVHTGGVGAQIVLGVAVIPLQKMKKRCIRLLGGRGRLIRAGHREHLQRIGKKLQKRRQMSGFDCRIDTIDCF